MLATLGVVLTGVSSEEALSVTDRLLLKITNQTSGDLIGTADSRRRINDHHCTWLKTRNAAISGHNREHLTSADVEDCKGTCQQRSWCKSFDFYKYENKCDLSDVQEPKVVLKTNYPGHPYDHYSFYCDECDIDEQFGPQGPHTCLSDSDCHGDRYCSGHGWCHGESNCGDIPSYNGSESKCDKWLKEEGRFDERGWVSTNGNLGEACINGKKWWYLISTKGVIYTGKSEESC